LFHNFIKNIEMNMENKTEKLFSEIDVTLETAYEVGLNEEEYNKILEKLGRKPTYTELGVFGVMWSEHCSYKNSILQLKTLPRSGGRLLVEAGEENAGLVDIGNGYAIAFKIESHNHPSAIEPFQGAATGVGGILRDIFTMGARPIASLNSLRFGELDNDRTKYLLAGVVGGIGHYGNSFGVPTVGGEVYFDNCYQDNPLVNAMAVGIVKIDKTASAAANGVGNPVMILGSSTGRDGIHGASLLASREFDEMTEDMRPTVQVGDPFSEKLLLEATLELIEAGVIVGIQDMGAAGISCSTSEMSARNEGIGMEIDLDKVPLREADMSAYEIMLSESQERMLAVIEKDKVEKAREICKKWDVPMTQIGSVTGDGLIKVWRNKKQVCEIKATVLVLGGEAPQNIRESKEPQYLNETRSFDINSLKTSISLEEAFWMLLKSPTIASKRWIYEQYDSQVRTNTVAIKGDAAIIRLKELPGKAIAVCTDCNERYTYLNPYLGGIAAVMEAARNVVCVGAEPVAITNCLNFGNPYDPEIYWQFKEVIRGMGDACRALNTPVTGGNVSFHNESQNHAIYPTPTIGMLGIIDDITKIMSAGFKNEGDYIYLVGNNREELGGSEYLKIIHGMITGEAPIIDIEEEKSLQKVILTAIKDGIINSAHDCSEGGLAICLAEKAILSDDNLGAEINLSGKINPGILFGESQSRVIVTVSDTKYSHLENLCSKNKVDFTRIGQVVKDKFEISGVFKSNVKDLRNAYERAIPDLMKRF
jgi:phosphoribosylformylglycinamidine synthase subunit PurL